MISLHAYFMIPTKEFNKVVKAISPVLIHLIKCHSIFNPRLAVLLAGIVLLDKKCNNMHVCQIIQFKRKMYSSGKFYSHWLMI